MRRGSGCRALGHPRVRTWGVHHRAWRGRCATLRPRESRRDSRASRCRVAGADSVYPPPKRSSPSGIGTARGVASKTADDRMVAKHREQFAGKVSGESGHTTVVNAGPLAVGTGQNQEGVGGEPRLTFYRTDDLHLLPAHHVRRRASLHDAGHKMHAAAIRLEGHHASGDRSHIGGTLDVRYLSPARTAADHACSQHGQIGPTIAPPAHDRQKRPCVSTGRQVLDTSRQRAAINHGTIGCEEIGPQYRCAPIDSDRRRL